MKKLWQQIGTVVFWLVWPALFVYLYESRRTRVLIVCGEEVLVVKNWLGSGRWSLPGGGRHGDETDEQAVRREAREELGLILYKKGLQHIGVTRFRGAGFRFSYAQFVVRLETKPKIRRQFWEISEVTWLPLKHAGASDVLPEVAATLAAWRARPDLLQ